MLLTLTPMIDEANSTTARAPLTLLDARDALLFQKYVEKGLPVKTVYDRPLFRDPGEFLDRVFGKGRVPQLHPEISRSVCRILDAQMSELAAWLRLFKK